MSIKNVIQRLKHLFCGSSGKKNLSGTIKFFDRKKRFGFIVSAKNEYFFHAAATKPEDFKLLQDGVKVSFSVVQGKKGPQADRIEIIND
jgi:CspA family cold shock protein